MLSRHRCVNTFQYFSKFSNYLKKKLSDTFPLQKKLTVKHPLINTLLVGPAGFGFQKFQYFPTTSKGITNTLEVSGKYIVSTAVVSASFVSIKISMFFQFE